jgi:aspartyl-tRNA(Asn)/glutamyl-tRNA(Gln) amidotransferase subunit A
MREALGGQMNLFHQRYDLPLTPAEPIAAFVSRSRWTGRAEMDRLTFTFLFNRPDSRVGAVRLTEAGLPAGLQIVGRRYEDERYCAPVCLRGHATG